jgi:hypothetical protein
MSESITFLILLFYIVAEIASCIKGRSQIEEDSKLGAYEERGNKGLEKITAE